MKAGNKTVIDCSYTMPLFFDDEEAGKIEELLDSAFADSIKLIVPSLWQYEVHNVLLSAMKRKRISRIEVNECMKIVSKIPIIENHFSLLDYQEIINLAAFYDLSFYDGAYLHLAISAGAKLATLDKRLLETANKCGVKLV